MTSSSNPTEPPTETLPQLISYPARPLSLGDPTRISPCLPWVAAWEPKVNGYRAVVHGPTGRMWNRQGQPLSIASEFGPALAGLARLSAETRCKWWDCEALDRRHRIGRGTLVVLDAMDWGDTYLERRKQFWQLPTITARPVSMKPVMRLAAFEDWFVVWRALQSANKQMDAPFFEGVVGKDVNSLYPLQLRNPDERFCCWVKMKWKW